MRCCVCQVIGVDIHHITPQAESGSDEESNAAPLCPTCHGRYGAKAEKRKFITECRDNWYRICNERYASAERGVLLRIESMLEVLVSRKDYTDIFKAS